MPSAQPNERHAIRDYQISGVECASKIAVSARLSDPMHTRNGDVTSLGAAPNPVLDLRNHRRDLYGMYGDTENAEARRRLEVVRFV